MFLQTILKNITFTDQYDKNDVFQSVRKNFILSSKLTLFAV